MSTAAAADVTVRGPDEAGVLTPEALELVASLERELGGRREELLRARVERQQRIAAGELPDFLEIDSLGARGRLAGRTRCPPTSRTGASRSPARPAIGRW